MQQHVLSHLLWLNVFSQVFPSQTVLQWVALSVDKMCLWTCMGFFSRVYESVEILINRCQGHAGSWAPQVGLRETYVFLLLLNSIENYWKNWETLRPKKDTDVSVDHCLHGSPEELLLSERSQCCWIPPLRAPLCEASVSTVGTLTRCSHWREWLLWPLFNWGVSSLRNVGLSPSALHESLLTYREEERELVFVNNPLQVDEITVSPQESLIRIRCLENMERNFKQSPWTRAQFSDLWWKVCSRKRTASLTCIYLLSPSFSPYFIILSPSPNLSLFFPFFFIFLIPYICIKLVSYISRPHFASVVFMFWHQRKLEEMFNAFSNSKGFKRNPCLVSQPLH